MLRKLTFLSLLSFRLVCSVHADGELEWESKSLVLECPVGAEKLTAEFRFQNLGSEAVEIVAVTSSCGCTVPELTKKIYEPEEEGTLSAIFTIGDRTGPQRKVLQVRTRVVGEETESRTSLSFRTDVPQAGSVQPRMILWRVGEDFEAKPVRIESQPGFSWRIAEPDKELPFEVSRSEEDEVGVDVLLLQPKANARRMKSSITVEFLDEEENVVGESKVFLIVR
ncbi:DUF1573 domain-containing protein [Puniceicoccus vermicola]|uniref:DUF1573 domain-containing protein n=1 Tax=Puniceicoccus vermicola TaxID=388746 RepID=A0A7X1AZY7_9BACT|nr:DUF1573 domain-containing protein [Puniceicoccus vermicola]MBC2603086.1 DUF1573 domain-containing protein [Puniceicoccus vermicola]